jgi:hypothetical protein
VRYFFAWLGSKRAAKREVAEPGCLLDRAANANLPVPAGGIVLHNFYELARQEGVITENDGLVTAVSPLALHDLLFNLARFPLLRRCDGGTAVAPHQLRAYLTPHPAGRCRPAGQLVMRRLVGARRPSRPAADHPTQERSGGNGRYPPNAPTDQIILPESQIALPQLGRWQRPDDSLPPHAQRLQMLLRGLRRTFGDSGWEIEWVDDGRICWLWELSALNPRE